MLGVTASSGEALKTALNMPVLFAASSGENHDCQIRRKSGIFSGMDTNAVLIDRLRQRLAETGKSAWKASKEATGSPDAIRQIEAGHQPSAARLEKLAATLNTTSGWLLGEDDTPRLADARSLFRHRDQPQDVPVYGTAMGADIEIDGNGHACDVEVTNLEMGEITGFLRRPPGLSGNQKAYALYVVGSSMRPRFDPGQAVFVDTRRPPAIGDDVIVQLVDAREERVVSALIKTLARRTSSYVELQQYSPDITFKIAMERIASIQRVLPWSELLGL
jgi:phage repressor protein C with HTH and peptisase S24 domain